jgi:PHD/YefM family antitoxin component YafN of YafNO toxin-antitoxin module
MQIILMNGLQLHGEHKTQWVTISMDEYNSMRSTIEILSSPKAMEKIRCGEQESLAGKGQKLENVKKELGL